MTDVRPLYWIIPEDLSVTCSRKELLDGALHFGHSSWVSEHSGALFVQAHAECTRGGTPVDYPNSVERIRPLSRFFSRMIGTRLGQTKGYDPSEKVWTSIWLPAGEEDKNWCMYSKSLRKYKGGFRVRCGRVEEWTSKWSEKDFLATKNLIEDWINVARNRGFYDELLEPVSRLEKVISHAADTGGEPEIGWGFIVSEETKCTWAWFELYLILRRNLSRLKRVSITFEDIIKMRQP